MYARRSNDLDEIFARLDVEAYVDAQGVEYRMTSGSGGPQLNIKECPRCGGAGWKVFLNAETGLGNCFHGDCVGNPGYNLFSFTRHLLGYTAKQTADHFREYAQRTGWLPKKALGRAKPKTAPDTLLLPESSPVNSHNPLRYLEERGFDAMTCEYFEWRYCEEGGYDYQTEDGEQRRQDYSGRVIIPVRDMDGKPVTFQGRDTTGTKERKYLFPPGLPGTGRYLYNGHQARGVPNVVLGEGVFDVAAIHLAFGSDPTVAAVGSFGKHLSGKVDGDVGEDQLLQLLKLKRAGMRRLVLMWDGEKQTVVDACREATVLTQAGIPTFIALLPEDCDPNEVSAEQVRAAYFNALPATSMNLARIRLTRCR